MTGAARESIDELSFEQALAQLERIVQQLEAGEVDLEASIGLYEEGQRLKAFCEGKLKSAQARIEKIQIGPDGTAGGSVPFDAD